MSILLRIVGFMCIIYGVIVFLADTLELLRLSRLVGRSDAVSLLLTGLVCCGLSIILENRGGKKGFEKKLIL